MANIIGGVQVTGFISPTDSSDTYAVIDPIYGVDGLRSVTGTTERNNITTERRREGMLVYVQSDGKYYKLLPSPWSGTNSDWVEFSVNSSGGTDTYWTSGSTGNFSIKAINNSGLEANGDYSVAMGNATSAYTPSSFATGLNSIASGSSITTSASPITITSAITITLSDPAYSSPAVILNGLVAAEWSGYYSNFCSLFTIYSGLSSQTIDCNSYTDIYEDSGLTYIVDSSIASTDYDMISGDTFQYVSFTISEPAFAIGNNVKAYGANSFAEGYFTTASGSASHAEGQGTTASGDYSHAEGYFTTANGDNSHAEGYYTRALGDYSHAEGQYARASGTGSHAEGNNTTANGDSSHAEGVGTTANGNTSHAEGYFTTASGNTSHAEGSQTKASGAYSHAEGSATIAGGPFSHAEGNVTTASGQASHAEGQETIASGQASHAEGQETTASGNTSHAEGYLTIASGDYSHAEGYQTTASGFTSHAEGRNTRALGDYSHAEGNSTIASGFTSHAEGFGTIASGFTSHAEGNTTTAIGYASHAEGYGTIASGFTSHAEGQSTTASGDYSHAGGLGSIASGQTSFVHGQNSVALQNSTIVLGSFITGTSANTTYVDNLNIKTLGGGTSLRNLGIDSIGNVVSGSTDFLSFNRITGTTYTAATSDVNNVIEMNSSFANILIVPPNSAVTISNGAQIIVAQYGSGQTTIQGGSGVILRSAGGFLKLAAQYSMTTLIKVGTNEWYVSGQLTA
jgi:hypothetical protein